MIYEKTNGEIYEGIIRIVNPFESFVTINTLNDVGFDVYIYGYSNLKNVLHGDTVRIRIIGNFEGRYNRRNKDRKKLFNDIDLALEKESINNESYDKMKNIENSMKELVISQISKRNVIPKYKGKIIQVIKSVTDDAPIVGYIRPLNYLLNIRNNLKNKKKKLNDVQKYFKMVGINDPNSKFRIDPITENINLNSKKFCFVPIKQIFPIMLLKLDTNSINRFIKPYLIEKNNEKFIPSKFLFGGKVNLNNNKNRYVRIVKTYGSKDNNNTNFMYLLDHFNLSSHIKLYKKFFNKKLDTSFSSKSWEKQNRKIFDKNEYRIFTIDPLNAKDLDDAIHIKFDNISNIFEIGIHIADVYYYMSSHKEVLCKIAKELCTSIYLPHLNFPMLPRQFSSDLCSLLPNKTRPTLSLIIKLDSKGNIIDEPLFCHGIITSLGKFSYEGVDEIFSKIEEINSKNKNDNEIIQKYIQDSNIMFIMKNSNIKYEYRKDIIKDLLLLSKISKILHDNRVKNKTIKLFNVKPQYNFSNKLSKTNPLFQIKNLIPFDYMKNNYEKLPNMEIEINIFKKNLDFNIQKVSLNNITVTKYYSQSHNLIEELMLLGNHVAAKYITQNLPNSCNILRSHEQIDDSQLKNLINYLRKNCMDDIFQDNITRGNIVQGLSKIYLKYGLLIYCTVSEMLRDIFKRAKYIVFDQKARNSNISTHHYALNTEIYTHFTSPIRRIPDIIVHQLLYKIIQKNSLPISRNKNKKNQAIFSDDNIREICQNANIKSNSSKNFQIESNKIFFTLLISKNHNLIPSISCVYKIKTKKNMVNAVLLYPTDICSVLIIEENQLKKLNPIRNLFLNQPPLPNRVKVTDGKLELIWKYNQVQIDNLSSKYHHSKYNIIDYHLSHVNKLLNNKFQSEIYRSERSIIQTIGIWSYLPVYLTPLNTIPPKFTIIPINPIEYSFYAQLLNHK